jgi:hypothetical protein
MCWPYNTAPPNSTPYQHLGEGNQNLLCAGLAVGVLAGLLANTTLGIWWLDPAVGLVIAVACVLAGRQSWRGEGCACTECAIPTVPYSS